MFDSKQIYKIYDKLRIFKKKIRIALNQNNELIINDVFDSTGAFLLIFGDAKVWESTNEYKRVE